MGPRSPRSRPASKPVAGSSFILTANTAVLTLAAAAIPLIVSPTSIDPFRFPKELAFQATAIVLVVIGTFAATRADFRWSRALLPRQEIALVAAILFWSLFTTWWSTNRQLSLDSLVTVFAATALFLSVRLGSSGLNMWFFDVVVISACVNAALVALQEYGIWNPFHFPTDLEHHMKSSALLGNPNDVGTFLVGPGIGAIVAAVVSAGRRRWFYVVLGGIVAVGIYASGTRTAFIAFMAGVLAVAVTRSRRHAAVLLAMLAVAAVLSLTPHTRLRDTIETLSRAAVERQYQVLFSERLPPFLAAIDMTRDYPLTGVGPGCFAYHYMRYRVALAERYPAEWTRGTSMNFGQVHNDHLQVLAETGVVGYMLFAAAIASVTGFANPFTRRPADDSTRATQLRRAFAHELRWPLATMFAVLALAQFPLQLAATRFLYVTLAGLILGWDERGRQ